MTKLDEAIETLERKGVPAKRMLESVGPDRGYLETILLMRHDLLALTREVQEWGEKRLERREVAGA